MDLFMSSPYNRVHKTASSTTGSNSNSNKNISSNDSSSVSYGSSGNNHMINQRSSSSDHQKHHHDDQEAESGDESPFDLRNLSKLILPPLGDSSSSNYQIPLSKGWIVSPMDSRYRFLFIYMYMKIHAWILYVDRI